jgi:uncharacterized protein
VRRLFSIALVAALSLAAVEPQSIASAPTQWVTDAAGLLSPGTASALNQKLRAYEQQTGHQVIVYIQQSLGSAALEDYTSRAFAQWKVGRKGLDDGLVLFMFVEERKVRIEVGYGLEEKVPDARAFRIIDEVIVPSMRAGQPDVAVASAVDAILEAIEGKPFTAPAPAVRERPRPTSSPFSGLLFVILGIGFLILFITNPTLALLLLSGIGRRGGGGWGGGGFGGGGFGGGGGRSGGGGASGSW